MDGGFREAIGVFDKLGVYDIILPFLLVFTIVFAILEKTKVLGIEKIGSQEFTKKNLNSVVAFVSALLVVASTKLVAAINESVANIVMLLLLSVFFLLLIGSFYKEGEAVALEKGWRALFMLIMFVGIVAIFMHGIKTDSGVSWLGWLWVQLTQNWDSNYVTSIVFVIVLVGAILYITRSNSGGSAPAKKE